MSIQNIKKLALFCVSVREKNSSAGYWDVLVTAENVREARCIGVDALEEQGLIKRTKINNTLIYKQETEVYHHV